MFSEKRKGIVGSILGGDVSEKFELARLEFEKMRKEVEELNYNIKELNRTLQQLIQIMGKR